VDSQKAPNCQNNPEQKEQCWRYQNTRLQKYYRTMVTKTTRHWHKTTLIDKWNIIKDTEISPHSYSHLILDKEAKNKQCRGRGKSLTMMLENLDIQM
jgi:hypothetical protein